MRIIAGRYRGKKLFSLGDAQIRPTGDRVKESLFQILSDRLQGARVLDLFCGSDTIFGASVAYDNDDFCQVLFCGSGALGLECLSRGASEVVFNDASPESLAVARKNLRAVGSDCKTLCYDYRICLSRVTGAFDLIFCDPPYKEDFGKEILGAVKARGLLSAGGLVVYESEREERGAEGWRITDRRSYGRCKITFFAQAEEP